MAQSNAERQAGHRAKLKRLSQLDPWMPPSPIQGEPHDGYLRRVTDGMAAWVNGEPR